jgi:hypothetical protein
MSIPAPILHPLEKIKNEINWNDNWKEPANANYTGGDVSSAERRFDVDVDADASRRSDADSVINVTPRCLSYQKLGANKCKIG